MEEVLVVPRDRLMATLPLPHDRCWTIDPAGALEVVRAHGRFAPRHEVESDPSLKQIIPYGFVTHDGRVFLLRRTRGGAEARLHEKLSLGVGGHVNPIDAPDGDLVEGVHRAFSRELHEELELPEGCRIRVFGLVNDDASAVGQVHFGVVYAVEAAGSEVRVREQESLTGAWASPAEVSRRAESLESWSLFLWRHLHPLRSGAAPPGRSAPAPSAPSPTGTG